MLLVGNTNRLTVTVRIIPLLVVQCWNVKFGQDVVVQSSALLWVVYMRLVSCASGFGWVVKTRRPGGFGNAGNVNKVKKRDVELDDSVGKAEKRGRRGSGLPRGSIHIIVLLGSLASKLCTALLMEINGGGTPCRNKKKTSNKKKRLDV